MARVRPYTSMLSCPFEDRVPCELPIFHGSGAAFTWRIAPGAPMNGATLPNMVSKDNTVLAWRDLASAGAALSKDRHRNLTSFPTAGKGINPRGPTTMHSMACGERGVT